MTVDGVASNRLAAVRAKLEQEGINAELLHDHTLIVTIPLEAGKSSYTLILNSENNPNSADTTQNLIPANDLFFPVFGRFGMKKVIKVAGVITNYAQPVYTYPDKVVFDAAAEQVQVASFFSGTSLTFQAENEEVIYKLSSRRLAFVPRTQAAAGTHASTGSVLEMEGWYCFSKGFGFAGRTQNKVVVDIAGFTPTADLLGDSAATATEGNFLVIELHGLLARGGEKAVPQGTCGNGTNKYLTY